jgi:RNA polymerase sigma-70 factor (ECF subfamily)
MTPVERQEIERELSAAFARGDLRAVGARLVEGYGPELLGLLVAILRDERAATDVFSQVGEDLWRGLPGFRAQSSFRTWAYTLTHHAAQRWRRDPLRRRGVDLAECPEVLEVAERVRTTTLTYLRSEVKDRVRRLREQLDPDEQLLLVLRIDRDLAWDEIADVIHGQCDDAKERTRRAASLRKRFERTKDRLRALVARDPSLRATDAT